MNNVRIIIILLSLQVRSTARSVLPLWHRREMQQCDDFVEKFLDCSGHGVYITDGLSTGHTDKRT